MGIIVRSFEIVPFQLLLRQYNFYFSLLQSPRDNFSRPLVEHRFNTA